MAVEKVLHIECGVPAGVRELTDWLDSKGYRYGYNGKECQRRAANNMPFITINVTTGFYSGSKGADVSVTWHKLNKSLWTHLIKLLPDIEEIHERAKKSDGAVDNNMRQPSKDGRKMERFWIMGNNRPMPISAMNDDHLHNTILMVDRAIANGESAVGMNQNLANLLDELEDERIHRGLHLPLMPYKSLEYRKGN